MSMPIYTAEDLATLTAIKDLPVFIEQRRSGWLAVFQDLMKKSKPLEPDRVKHTPGLSKAELKFIDHQDLMSLGYLFQGIGHEIRFKEIEVGKFQPVIVRELIEITPDIEYAIGECNLETGKTTSYRAGALSDEMEGMDDFASAAPLKELTPEDRAFAESIKNAADSVVRDNLARRLEAIHPYLRRSEGIRFAAYLREPEARRDSFRFELSQLFLAAAQRPAPLPPARMPAPSHLKDALEIGAEGMMYKIGMIVPHVCKQIKTIKALSDSELLLEADLLTKVHDKPDLLYRTAIALQMPFALQSMVLRTEPAPVI